MRTEHHWPANLPRLRWLGEVVEPTSGDVDAIHLGAVRLLRGETIESDTPRGEPVRVVNEGGRTVVTIGTERHEFASAFDALVVAYGAIDEFNLAWPAFSGGE
jgi:hypothetical protein